MSSARREPKTPKLRRAEPVRSLLQKFLREKLKSSKSKGELAAYLGLSTSAVEAMIYHGQGGLDTWIGALMHCYQVPDEAVPAVLAVFVTALTKSLAQNAIDQAWNVLQGELTPQEKEFWIRLIEASRKDGLPGK